MTTEHLKASIIRRFGEQETDLLLKCVMYNEYPVKFINIMFDYEYNHAVAVYSCKSRRFIKLVYGNLKIQL